MASKILACSTCGQLQMPFFSDPLPCVACQLPLQQIIDPDSPEGWKLDENNTAHYFHDGDEVCMLGYSAGWLKIAHEVNEKPADCKICDTCESLMADKTPEPEGWTWHDEEHQNRYHYYREGITLCTRGTMIECKLDEEAYDELVDKPPRGAKKCKACKLLLENKSKPESDRADLVQVNPRLSAGSWSLVSFQI